MLIAIKTTDCELETYFTAAVSKIKVNHAERFFMKKLQKNIQNTEAVIWKCFLKRVFLKIL